MSIPFRCPLLPSDVACQHANLIRHRLTAVLQGILIFITLTACLLFFVEAKQRRLDAAVFADALEAAEAGRWHWDLKTDELTWDTTMFHVFGISRGDFKPYYEGFESTVHPDDLPRLNAVIEACIKNRTRYRAVFRVIDDEGDIRYIYAAGKVASDGTYMTGISLISSRTEVQIPLPSALPVPSGVQLKEKPSNAI